MADREHRFHHHRYHSNHDHSHSHEFRRSRSPSSWHRSSKRRRSPPSPPQATLPFRAPQINKHDFAIYKPMFALYLDIQKQLVLEDMPENDVRGRWKSFVGKCYEHDWNGPCQTKKRRNIIKDIELTFARNRGELAEGWYDPATLQKAITQTRPSPDGSSSPASKRRGSPMYGEPTEADRDADTSSGDDLVGPAPPPEVAPSKKNSAKPGPVIPNFQELELQRAYGPNRPQPAPKLADRAIRIESAVERQHAERFGLRHARTLDRKRQKEALDELVPRAEAGTRERQLEKKREVAVSNRSFAAQKDGGDVPEVAEADLLGDDGGAEGFKKQKREMERKKNEREVRRDEILRARKEEREERVREARAREEKTMSGLVALARAKFG